jgi:hypothetical protein
VLWRDDSLLVVAGFLGGVFGGFGRCSGVVEVGLAPEECALLCDSRGGEVFPFDRIDGMLGRLFARLRGFLN